MEREDGAAYIALKNMVATLLCDAIPASHKTLRGYSNIMMPRFVLVCSLLLLLSLPAGATVNGKAIYVKASTVPATVVKRFEGQFEREGESWARTCTGTSALLGQPAQMEEYRGHVIWTHVVDKIDGADRLNGLTHQEGWEAYYTYSRENPDEQGRPQWSMWHETPSLQYDGYEAKTINGVRTGHDDNDRGCKPGLNPKVSQPLFAPRHRK